MALSPRKNCRTYFWWFPSSLLYFHVHGVDICSPIFFSYFNMSLCQEMSFEVCTKAQMPESTWHIQGSQDQRLWVHLRKSRAHWTRRSSRNWQGQKTLWAFCSPCYGLSILVYVNWELVRYIKNYFFVVKFGLMIAWWGWWVGGGNNGNGEEYSGPTYILKVEWRGHGGWLYLGSERERERERCQNGSYGSLDSRLGRNVIYQEGGLSRGNRFGRGEGPLPSL